MNNHTINSPSISKWVFYTTIGWIQGFILALLLADPLASINLEFLGFGVGISAGIGFMQWIALKKSTLIGSKWIWLTIIGMGSSFLLLNMLIIIANTINLKYEMDGVPFIIATIVATALGSYFVGNLQQKMLLENYISKSEGWVLYTFLGWTISAVFITSYFAIFGRLHIERIPLGAFVNIVVAISGGPIIGYLTGKKMITIRNTEE